MTIEETIYQKFQLYRNLKELLQRIKDYDWPTDLVLRIEKELYPLIQAEDYKAARTKFKELNQLRMERKYNVPND